MYDSWFKSEFYQKEFEDWSLIQKCANLFNIELNEDFPNLIDQFEKLDFQDKQKVIEILQNPKKPTVYWNYLLYKRALAEEKLYNQFQEKGIEVSLISKPTDEVIKVYSVTLDFTPEQWYEIIRTDGEYLPSCCAVISNIRDSLISCLRNNGELRVHELFDIVESLKGHHDCEDTDFLESKLINILEEVKPYADFDRFSSKNINEINDAFHTLAQFSSYWDFQWLIKDPFELKGCKLLSITKIAPIISTIYQFINEKCGDKPLKGYAVVREKDNQIEIVKIQNNSLVFYELDDLEKCKEFVKQVNEVNENFNAGYIEFEIQLGQQIKFIDEIKYVS